MCEYILNIADLGICFQTDYVIRMIPRFVPFIQSKKQIDITVNIRETSELIRLSDDVIYEGTYFSCCNDSDNRILKTFYTPGIRKIPYAQALTDFSVRNVDIKYLPEGMDHLSEMGNSFFHIGLGNLLAYENRLILHSCCIDTFLGGILFSGPSGIGKSTQGELWKKYEQAEVINGDRSILYRDKDSWYGYGSPYAGSSRYYVNNRTQIKAIVMLKKAPHCSVRRLNAAEAFHALYPMTTICVWDSTGVGNICSLLEQLIREVPVYEMSCTPDDRAIAILKKVLMQENCNNE